MITNVPARVPVSVWDTFWLKKMQRFFNDMRLLRTVSVFERFFDLFLGSKKCHPRVPVKVWHDFFMNLAETLTGTHGCMLNAETLTGSHGGFLQRPNLHRVARKRFPTPKHPQGRTAPSLS